MKVLEVDEDIKVVTRGCIIQLPGEYGELPKEVLVDCLEEYVFSYYSDTREITDSIYSNVVNRINDSSGELIPEVIHALIGVGITEFDYVHNLSESIESILTELTHNGSISNLNSYIHSVNVVDVEGSIHGDTLLLKITNTE